MCGVREGRREGGRRGGWKRVINGEENEWVVKGVEERGEMER